MGKKITIQIPSDWRKGQFIFNFLEYLKKQGIPTNQNHRLADTFHISDKDFEKYLDNYLKEKKESNE